MKKILLIFLLMNRVIPLVMAQEQYGNLILTKDVSDYSIQVDGESSISWGNVNTQEASNNAVIFKRVGSSQIHRIELNIEDTPGDSFRVGYFDTSGNPLYTYSVKSSNIYVEAPGTSINSGAFSFADDFIIEKCADQINYYKNGTLLLNVVLGGSPVDMDVMINLTKAGGTDMYLALFDQQLCGEYLDPDGDGVLIGDDECPYTQPGATVNSVGCTDDDEDGYYPDADPGAPTFDPDDTDPCNPDDSAQECNVVFDLVYNELSLDVQPGYANMNGGNLSILYKEKYAVNNKVQVNIYDQGHQLVNPPIELINNYGRNFHTLDLSNYTLNVGEIYLLELIGTNKNTVYYLHFKYNNL